MSPGRRLGRRNRPVFIERSGRRRRLLRSFAAVLGCACAGYLVFLTLVFHALQQPAGKAPPKISEPLPTSNARHDSRLDDNDSDRARNRNGTERPQRTEDPDGAHTPDGGHAPTGPPEHRPTDRTAPPQGER
ncbi:hypothetical protein [Streptomyces armeniacus]|uniref:hypothetical protein n=1 Tax=Streptomyces armeniacus TaxID=83291 RepID=UPI001AD7F2A6|nr:hypothetical protein [Streptomyces armeniacus]